MVHKQIFYTSKDINILWGQMIRKKICLKNLLGRMITNNNKVDLDTVRFFI